MVLLSGEAPQMIVKMMMTMKREKLREKGEVDVRVLICSFAL